MRSVQIHPEGGDNNLRQTHLSWDTCEGGNVALLFVYRLWWVKRHKKIHTELIT